MNATGRAPMKVGKEEWMKEPYQEEVATHLDPESCAEDRKVQVKR